MSIWFRVARQITGVSAQDRNILRRALMHAPLDALSFLDEWRDPQVDLPCKVSSKIGRFNVRPRSDDLYLVLPSREPIVLAAISSMLRPGDCFIDAGASIGVYTVLASRLVGNGGKVIAIEMMPDTADVLRGHVAENACANVDVVEAALSDVAEQTLTADVEPGKFGSASIAVSRDGKKTQVKTTTLANVIGNTTHVRLIKMDLEGAELAAARGLGSTLPRVDAILFEDWGDKSISGWFRRQGYEVTRLDANNSLASSQLVRDSEVRSGSH